MEPPAPGLQSPLAARSFFILELDFISMAGADDDLDGAISDSEQLLPTRQRQCPVRPWALMAVGIGSCSEHCIQMFNSRIFYRWHWPAAAKFSKRLQATMSYMARSVFHGAVCGTPAQLIMARGLVSPGGGPIEANSDDPE